MPRRDIAALTLAAAPRSLPSAGPASPAMARPALASALLSAAAVVALAALAASLAPAAAHAQAMGVGLGNVGPDLPAPAAPVGTASVLTATLSQSVEANTNYRLDRDSPGTSYFGDTRLTLDLLQQTEAKTFGAGIDTGVRPLWEAGQSFDVVAASPSTAYLTYDQEGPNTAFDSLLRFRSSQVDDELLVDDNGTATPLDQLGTARQSRFDANVGFVFGTDDPSSYEFRLRATSIEYADEDPGLNLVPRQNANGEVTWNLDITPVLATVVSAQYQYQATDDDLSTRTRTTSLDAGLAYTRSDTLRIRGGLGYGDREQEQDVSVNNSNRTTERDNGPLVRGDVRYITSDVTFLASAEYTTAAPENQLTGNLSAIYNLPRGQLVGQVFQNYSTGTGGDDERITGLGIGITRDINTVSSVGLNAAWAQQVDTQGDNPEIRRTTFTARYTHEITELVTGQVGYSYRNRDEDGASDSNEVFMVIGRSFETGF
jgi:hypothetical protein